MEGATRRSLISKILVVGTFLILSLFLVFIFDSIETIYNVTAKTEIIKAYSSQKPRSRINLFDADIYTLDNNIENWKLEEKLIVSSFNGSIEMHDSTSIKLERIANGPLLIEIERPKGGKVATLRYSESTDKDPITVSDILFIEIKNIYDLINNNISVVIPFTGEITLGKSIEVESDNEYSLLLQSGDITMTGYTRLGKNYFVAGHEKLFLGDKLVFNDKNSIGIATVNTEPAIQVSYRAVGKEAKIIKPGPRDLESGYSIAASTFSRFKYDSFFQGISIVIGILLFTITVWEFYLNLKNSNN